MLHSKGKSNRWNQIKSKLIFLVQNAQLSLHNQYHYHWLKAPQWKIKIIGEQNIATEFHMKLIMHYLNKLFTKVCFNNISDFKLQ